MSLLPVEFACLTLVSTGVGGATAIRLRDRLHLLLGFSAGAVLAVALFEMMPQVFALSGGGSAVMPLAAVGFLFFFALERYAALHRAREHMHAHGAHESELGAFSAAALAFHSFLDGVAIGTGFQASFRLGLLMALGVIVHDFDDGLNTVTVVLSHKGTPRSARHWLVVDMLAPVFGAAATLLVGIPESVLPWLLAFFAGCFLYIGASDLLPEAREHHSPLVAFATAGGMLFILVLIRLLPS
jgi:zinc transporter ZupT